MTVELQDSAAAGAHSRHENSNVAVWLTPKTLSHNPAPAPAPERYRLIQKDKMFSPHMLLVPVGTSVEFPNLDPFYHNVFSLFNGKRFDLGLYEAGSTRSVRFDHEGVSYIFCNIHPEMAAVVIALTTPYFAVSDREGRIIIRDVPAGMYDLHVWAEGVRRETLEALSHAVRIEPHPADLGTLRVIRDESVAAHKNKFGEEYQPQIRPY